MSGNDGSVANLIRKGLENDEWWPQINEAPDARVDDEAPSGPGEHRYLSNAVHKITQPTASVWGPAVAKLALIELRILHDQILSEDTVSCKRRCKNLLRDVRALVSEDLRGLPVATQQVLAAQIFGKDFTFEKAHAMQAGVCETVTLCKGRERDEAKQLRSTIENASDFRTDIAEITSERLDSNFSIPRQTLVAKMVLSIQTSLARISAYNKTLGAMQGLTGFNQFGADLRQVSNSIFHVPLVRVITMVITPTVGYVYGELEDISSVDGTNFKVVVNRLRQLEAEAVASVRQIKRITLTMLLVNTGLKVLLPYLQVHVAFAGFMGVREYTKDMQHMLAAPPWGTTRDMAKGSRGRECLTAGNALPKLSAQAFLVAPPEKVWKYFTTMFSTVEAMLKNNIATCRVISSSLDAIAPREPKKVVLMPRRVVDEVLRRVNFKKAHAVDQIVSACVEQEKKETSGEDPGGGAP